MNNSELKVLILAIIYLIIGALCSRCRGEEIVIGGSSTVGPVAEAFAEYCMARSESVNITVSRSGIGFRTA